MKSAVAAIGNSSSTSWVCYITDNTGWISQLREIFQLLKKEWWTLQMFVSSDTHVKPNRTSHSFAGFRKQSFGSMHQSDFFVLYLFAQKVVSKISGWARCLGITWILLYSSHKLLFFSNAKHDYLNSYLKSETLWFGFKLFQYKLVCFLFLFNRQPIKKVIVYCDRLQGMIKHFSNSNRWAFKHKTLSRRLVLSDDTEYAQQEK